MTNNSSSSIQTCDQCGLPYGRGGVARPSNGTTLHFCCYGCSFTNVIVGEKGEAGSAGLFLARLGFAAFLSMNIMALSWVIYDQKWATFGIEPEILPYLEKLLFVTATPIMLFIGYPYVRIALREIRSLRFSMDSLIALGSFAAYGFSTYQVFVGGRGIYFDTATTTLVLVTAGRYLEATAKIRTADAIKKLMDLQPDIARAIRGKKEQQVPTGEVSLGEKIKILPGERVPLDGILLQGRTTINESALTGESLPRSKAVGDAVFAATVNGEGAILVRVTARQQETVHAHTVRLMEEAQRSRSPLQQSVDKISGIFIPLVVGISAVTFVGWIFFASVDIALLHALTVLVVACPCALGIGTPLANAIAIGYSAGQGILVRSGGALEKLARTNIVAFDKTGTLTKGEFIVSEFRSEDEKLFLPYLASLEQSSEHPLSKAIVSFAEKKKVGFFETRNVTAVPGVGIKGEIKVRGGWKFVYAGTREMLEQAGLKFSKKLFSQSSLSTPDTQTIVYAGWDGVAQGYVQLQDSLRQNAKEVVQTLHQAGISTALLSGDAEHVTQHLAQSISIQQAYGKLLPNNKLEILGSLKSNGVTVMVGDGINDAPSLAAADIGITLGSATDIAKESADVTILGDHLEKIPWLIRFAHRTLAIIRWNLFWAFGYNAVGIALAVTGILQPVLAAVAMVVSSLFIIINSRRLSRFH